jgi:hypothetical protein
MTTMHCCLRQWPNLNVSGLIQKVGSGRAVKIGDNLCTISTSFTYVNIDVEIGTVSQWPPKKDGMKHIFASIRTVM